MKKNQKKILLVEDEDSLRELYFELLTDEGFVVKEAKDGQQALDLLQKGGYDLVLLDILLPRLSGPEVLSQLKKKKPQKPNGPVVALTNLGKEAIDNEKGLGIKGYLIKSDLAPDQFLAKVKQYLES